MKGVRINEIWYYVFDLWAQQWRSRYAQGNIAIVRHADGLVVGFEHEADAGRFLAYLRCASCEAGSA